MRDRTRLSFLFAAFLLASACGSDSKREADDDDDGEPVTGERDGGAAPDGTDGSLDGGPGLDIDSSLAPDGALPDAAPLDAAPDAEADAAPDAASPGCDVNDPKYGCGTLSGTDWVSFPDFEVDLANNVAWQRPVTVVDDDDLRGLCAASTAGGFEWVMPQMEDVRKLAAGCPQTLPGGSCQVYVDEVLTSEAGDCTCDPSLVGPHDGKFCRPEIPECETLWVWTHTFETGFYQHWFYDVKTGSLQHEVVGVGIALEAKGRCMHVLADNELPVLL